MACHNCSSVTSDTAVMFLINDPFTISVHGLQLCTVTLKTVVDRQSNLADIIVHRKQQKLTDKHNTSVRCELS